ncbi:calcium-independent phospholipase A2-gamma-like [Dermacentor andersoni]|uniref:calcium-independent phospholipase A2-gamma-like n=1 Tax=Dermacentor andersoni TaxID=34620 RepID=UPI00215510D2|nr:calcium-independent phospholipase A2-gamma-like [Dermacentor andersoni]
MLARRTHWIARSNGYCWRRPSSSRLKRKPGLTLTRQNSTSKSMPNPYWTSKLTNSLERLQSKTRLKLNARVLFDSIAAFRDTHFQRMVLLLRSSASTQHRMQVRPRTDLETQGASQSSADDGRADVENLKQTPSESLGSWRELLRKAITPDPGAGDHQTVQLGVQQATNKDLSSGDSVVKGEMMVRDPAKGDTSWQEFAKAQESEVNKILSELELAQDQKPKPQKEDVAAADTKSKVPAMSQVEIDRTSRALLKSVVAASSPASQVARLEELNNHILSNPSSLCILVKERAIAHILRMREYSNNSSVMSTARETLALLGYVDPPRGRGLRILSIDGGGTRGILAIELLRQLELCTGQRVFELFDYVAGVSTGAILGYLLGGLHTSLDRCESLYRSMSLEVFTQNAWWGTGRLVWSHAYYDTSYWTDAIRRVFEDKTLLETTRNSCSPKVGAISVAVNQPTLKPYVFRNYNLPHRVESHYYGSCKYKMWQAIRASGAAPGYFEEYDLDGFVHQDGGLMCNNPTAVAIHEAKLLWPNEPIQCVVSLGGGRFIPEVTEQNQGFTSLKKKILKVIDSATDTEAVHTTVQDLLPPNAYFRFNPYLSEWITLDENRAEKLDQLKQDAQMYLRRNSEKFDSAVKSLLTKRGPMQRVNDWLRMQLTIKW